eukprot:g4387.t1
MTAGAGAGATPSAAVATTRMSLAGGDLESSACSRSEALGRIGAAFIGAAVVGAGVPAPASAASVTEANRKLSQFNLPPVVDVPDGFNTLLEGYGKDGGLNAALGSSNRDPILVTWNYPKGWIVQRPNTDTNKEAGTVSTGDYGRGDSAGLFVAPKSLMGGSSLSSKEVMEGVVKKALSQKGDNQFQSFKLKSVKDGATDFNGNKYYIADFQYELLTGAGFTVERKGVASVAQIGNSVTGVVGATTANRAKTVKPQLQEIAASFRIRERNREVYRVEVGQPGVKWRMFQEQCRKEQRGLACLENQANKDKQAKEPSPVVEAVLKHTAGVEQSLWEIPHAKLLSDASKGAPGLLELDRSITGRLMGSSRSHGSLMGVSKLPRDETPMIRAFRAKLQKMIDKRVRDSGGSPRRILKSLFLNWDTERNGTLDTDQLRGALRTLNMRLSATQAKEVSRFYAKNGDGAAGCDFLLLVEDVCGYDQGPFVHPSPKRQASSSRSQEEEWEDTSASAATTRSDADSERSPPSLRFTARPLKKPANRRDSSVARVVDRFKMRLRDALEQAIKKKGGVHHAIIREAFLNWDADASGKLDPRELRGALKRMGVYITEEEADAAVCYYDLDGTGEMSYELLCEEIKAISHPILSYIEEVDVLEGLNRTVRVPPNVEKVLGTIRAGVKTALRRSCSSSSSSSSSPRRDLLGTGEAAAVNTAVAFPPISPRDLLQGTCLRFDRTHDRGVLGVDELRQVWRELKIHLRTSETKALVAWFDRSTTNKIHASDLCEAIYGTPDVGASSFREKINRQPPPQPPRKPHIVQAQKSAALANGGSSCSPPRAPVRAQGEHHGAPERRPQIGDGKIAWNWQGRRGSSAAAGAVRDKGGANTDKKPLQRGVHGAAGGPVRFGGVLQAGGEAVVGEKARIEKRLKELQRERAMLLREKNGLARCWEERGGGGRTSSNAPAGRCGG